MYYGIAFGGIEVEGSKESASGKGLGTGLDIGVRGRLFLRSCLIAPASRVAVLRAMAIAAVTTIRAALLLGILLVLDIIWEIRFLGTTCLTAILAAALLAVVLLAAAVLLDCRTALALRRPG